MVYNDSASFAVKAASLNAALVPSHTISTAVRGGCGLHFVGPTALPLEATTRLSPLTFPEDAHSGGVLVFGFVDPADPVLLLRTQ